MFALFPRQPVPNDPTTHMEEERRRTVDLLNMVVCELALACGVACNAFSVSDLGGAMYSENPEQVYTWVATRPYAPASLRQEADMRDGSDWVTGWERSSADEIAALTHLPYARALRGITTDLPALVAGAVGHYHRGRPSEATLFGWMVCERLVHHGWETRIAASTARTRHPRDARTRTAAFRIEDMRRKGWLSDTDFDLLSAARRARNQQAHNRAASADDAKTTVLAMLATLEHVLVRDAGL